MLILLLILKIHRIGRDVLLNEKVQRISETEFVIEKEKYEPIILIFNEADNKEVENSILITGAVFLCRGKIDINIFGIVVF